MKPSRILVRLIALAALTTGGCSEPEQQTVSRHPELANRVATHYARALRVDLSAMDYRPHSGLYVEDLRVGEGARADSGDVVSVHYSGWLSSGRLFDSSRDGEPLEVAIGYGQVIDGWDQGIVGMRPGGQRRLVIPPALGYGVGGSGPIPGNATLVFDVELLEVEDRTTEPDGAGEG